MLGACFYNFSLFFPLLTYRDPLEEMDSFKVPLSLPQDLLLIQSLVGATEAIPSQKKAPSVPIEDDIGSSGSEPDSEDEIEAELVGKTEPEPYVPFDSCSLCVTLPQL